MEFFLKAACILMLLFLLFSQLLLLSPYAEKLYHDDLNGTPIKSYQTIVKSGVVRLELLGNYRANSASLLINGEHIKTIDSFPISIALSEGDVVEISSIRGNPSFYVFLAGITKGIITDMSSSTVRIDPGIHRVFKVLAEK